MLLEGISKVLWSVRIKESGGHGSIQYLPSEEPLRAAAEVLGRGLRAQSEKSVVKTASSRVVHYKTGMQTYRKRPNKITKMQVSFLFFFFFLSLFCSSSTVDYYWVLAADVPGWWPQT